MSLASIALTAFPEQTEERADSRYCIFLDGETEALSDVIIIDVDIKESSKIMTSPTESGTIISDHRVFMPVEITVNCTLTPFAWGTMYNEMRAWYEQTDADFLTICTRADSYDNMQLISIPHKEAADSVSRLFFELKFQEVQLVTADYVDMPADVVEDPGNASSVDAGEKSADEVEESSLYKSVLS